MTLARIAAQTLTQLTTLTRLELRDPDTDADGNSIPSGARRWSDTEVQQSINLTLVMLGTKLSSEHSGESLAYVETTYTAAADQVDLPAGVGAEPVFKVEDLTSSSGFARNIPFMSPAEIERLQSIDPVVMPARRAFTLVASTTAGSYALQIRPKPTDSFSIRIWYYGAPLYAAAGTDAHPFAARWQELIALDAAARLLSVDNEASDQQLLRRSQQLDLFDSFARRFRGPEHIRNARRAR